MSTVTSYDLVAWPNLDISQFDDLVAWPDGDIMAWSSFEETTEFTLGRPGRGNQMVEYELAPIPPKRAANAISGVKRNKNPPISGRAPWRK